MSFSHSLQAISFDSISVLWLAGSFGFLEKRFDRDDFVFVIAAVEIPESVRHPRHCNPEETVFK